MEKLDPKKYNQPGQWLKDMRLAGFLVPLALMAGVTRIMRKYDISFGQGYEMLEKHGKIVYSECLVIYDLTGDSL